MPDATQQTIHVKRKRTDEPVDQLYVEDPSTKKRQLEYIFKRVGAEDVKRVRVDENPSTPLIHSNSSPNLGGHPDSTPPKHQRDLRKASARRFHLSKSESSTPVPNSPSGGLKKRKLDTPIFYESRKRAADYLQKKPVTLDSALQPPKLEHKVPVAPRKRPQATSAEQRFRQERNEKSQAKSAPTDTDKEDEAASRHLDRFLNLAKEVDDADHKVAASPYAGIPKPKITHRPKVPVRRKDRFPQPEAMGVDSSDEADFVTDTYVRVPLQDGVDADMTGDDYGVLVIQGEEQELWDMWVNEGELDSDKEFDTDDEDENAEDYYAADYPEDEVDSDDEMDRDPYQYRRNASDDEDNGFLEDIGSDAGAYSDEGDDEEEDLSRPWKRHPWQ